MIGRDFDPVLNQFASQALPEVTTEVGLALPPRDTFVALVLEIPSTSIWDESSFWTERYAPRLEGTAATPAFFLTFAEEDHAPLSLPPLLTTDIRGEEEASVPQTIAELRRISGLTFEQLRHAFRVSRRALHFWASGKKLNTNNERHLYSVLDVVRHVDRGSARANRAALLGAYDGNDPLQLLADRRYEDVKALLGRGVGRDRQRQLELSKEAREARRPLPPAVLADARHEPVNREVRGRVVKTVRNEPSDNDDA